MPNEQTAMKDALKKDSVSKKAQFQGLPLSEAQEAELVTKIIADVESDTSARKEFLDKITEIMDMYEGKVLNPHMRFEDEMHCSTRVVTMVVETLHSILFPSIWNEDLQYWSPEGTEDIPTAEQVNKFMAWDARYTKMAQFVDDWVKHIVLEGTVVTKTRWCEDYTWVQHRTPKKSALIKKIKTSVLNILNRKMEPVEMEAGDYDITYIPKKKEYCDVDIIPLEDVGFPPFNSYKQTADQLDRIWHRTRKFIYEIQELETRGFFKVGSTEKISTFLETLTRDKIEGTTKQRMDAEGSAQVTIVKNATPAHVIEWYSKYEIDGVWEDVVVWVEERSKTFLAATYLRKLNKFNKRPFNIAQFIRRPGRLYGMSAGEVVKEFESVMNEMLSININAAKMAVYPPGFYRAASGFDPEKVTIQPGIMIPVDDINDVKWVQVPNNVLPTSQEMKFIMELVAQVSNIGAYQTGQESNVTKTRSTARGTLALISQGERRFVVLGKRLQYMLAQIMESKLEYYQQFLPPDLAAKILGPNNAALFPNGLDTDDIAGDYNLWMSLDSTGGSKSLKVQNANEMYAAYMPNPLVQQDPSRVWEVSAKPLKESGEIDIERYLGPKPPTIEEIQQQQQAQQIPGQPAPGVPGGASSPIPGAPQPPPAVPSSASVGEPIMPPVEIPVGQQIS